MSRLVRLRVSATRPGARGHARRVPRVGRDPAVSTDRLNKEIDNVTSPTRPARRRRSRITRARPRPSSCSSRSTARLERLPQHPRELHKKYSDKGVGFLAVVPTDDDGANVAKKAGGVQAPVPSVLGSQARGHRSVQGALTPEASYSITTSCCVIAGDRQRVLRPAQEEPAGHRTDLGAQSRRSSAGRTWRRRPTRAIGCHIDPKAKERKVTSEDVTYHRDVAPILQKHCQSCHRPATSGRSRSRPTSRP